MSSDSGRDDCAKWVFARVCPSNGALFSLWDRRELHRAGASQDHTGDLDHVPAVETGVVDRVADAVKGQQFEIIQTELSEEQEEQLCKDFGEE